MRERPGAFLMPRAKSARGKVRGALPRTPARGKPPETPARFPFCLIFQNGPRRQGCAPKNLFKGGKDFSPPRSNRAPLTAPGRSEDWLVIRKSGTNAKPKPSSLASLCGLPLVGPERLQPVWRCHTSNHSTGQITC